MSYQEFLRSTGHAASTAPPAPSPKSLHRKAPGSLSPPAGPLTSHTNTTRISSPKPASSAPLAPTSAGISTGKPSAPSTTVPVPAAAASATDPLLPRLSPARMTLTKAQIDAALQTCLDVQTTATTLHGKRPFAAVLLGPDNCSILLTHFSVSHVQHAETELARLATIHFSQRYLADCTLVSTWEPCAMCTGTLYWSNIGRLVYGAGEDKLKEMTDGHNEENMTMSLPCREVLKAGQKDIEVIGPVRDWETRVVEESGRWWKDHGAADQATATPTREGSVNGSEKPGSLASTAQSTPTTWTGEDSVLSRIDDEGEYKAELNIDWMN